MIALDIHFYMKHGSIMKACDSIFSFLDNFAKYLSFSERSKLIQTAFYLLQVSRFGQCYLPDYAMRFFDITYSLEHYGASHDIFQDRYNSVDPDNEDYSMVSEEREIVEKVFD